MDILVLDESFTSLQIVDVYESFIWTDRYNECGDFEFYANASTELIELFKPNRYLTIPYSNRLMIIEDQDITTDDEDGDHLKVTGRSLESILDRRIVWKQTILNGDFQNGVQRLLNENVINPSISSRKIANFIFVPSTDTRITSLKIDAQYTGDNLYEVICSLCKERKIGFYILLNNNNQFEFHLYAGDDRRYDQTALPFVVFSPEFDNIISTEYFYSMKTLKNVTLIGGEGEGAERRYTTVGDVSGLSRRELFTDARDISSKGENDTVIPDAEYIAQLQTRGKEKLAENKLTETFDGEAAIDGMYVYGEDYFLGDVVNIRDIYRNEGDTRIVEMIVTQDSSGFRIYPTFEVVEEE